MESISELNDSNINKICRTCLTINTEEMTSIFDKIHQVENDENVTIYICGMLMDVALIELDIKESLPTSICINCLRLAQQLFNFRKQCNRSQAILLQYLSEQQDKIRTLGTKNDPNKQSMVLNKNSAIKERIDIEKTLNVDERESTITKNDVHELSNHSSSDDLLNATIKLECDDEIIKLDTESRKEDVLRTLVTKQNPNKQSNGLNKKPAIKESIDTEKYLNEDEHDNITLETDVNQSSNLSNSADLLNASIKLEFDDEIIEPGAESEYKETLHSNINFDKDKNVITCQLCDKAFKSDTLYFAHMKEHPENKCVCSICNKHFKHRTYLTNHIKQHAADVCVCKVCNKRFKRPWNLTVHMYTHKDEKRFSCKICGKQYKQSGSVTVHMRKHTGQTPFLCTVCGKAFRDSTCYKTHMRSHTKERPYMCNICGITISTQCQLTEHMRIHTGERPYKCTECSKAFRSSSTLKRHSIVHTGLKPFSCDVCKKSFNRKSTLTLHEKIHSNERPHTCQLCGKSFIQAHCLRTHLQNHK